MICFIVGNNRMWIGLAKHPDEQLQSLQVDASEPLIIYAAVPGGRSSAVRVHQELVSFHDGGGWFVLETESWTVINDGIRRQTQKALRDIRTMLQWNAWVTANHDVTNHSQPVVTKPKNSAFSLGIRLAILNHLRYHDGNEPQVCKDIAVAISQKENSVRQVLNRLLGQGLVEKCGNGWLLSTESDDEEVS